MSAAFDTLRIARDLEAAGVERRQAEAHAEALRIVADSARADAATKADLAATAAKLASKADLDGFATKADLEAAIETAIAKLETRMLKYGLGMVLATVSLTVALIKLL